MQVKDAYDLIVIGDQLSGLFLAAGAAQMGKRVLVLQESAVPTVSFDSTSGRFLGDFATEPVIGLKEGSPADLFLRSLGLYENFEDLFLKYEPSLQVVGEKFRFDFSYDPASIRKELGREFPSLPELPALLSGSVVERGSFGRAVARAGYSVEFEQFGWMQAAAYGALAPQELSYPGYKEILQLASQSVRFPIGGRSALTERLIGRIKAFGGNIKRATRVEEIIFERGRLAGVLLSSFEGFVRSKMVVGAMGAKNFFGLVPAQFQNSTLRQAVGKVHPRFWRFNFTVLLPETVLPEGMGSHLVFTDEEEFLQLQIFPKDAYGGIAPGERALLVRTLVPFEESSLGEKAVARHLKRSLARLRQIIPFLDQAKARVSPDPDRLATDPAYQRYYRFRDLDHIPPVFLVYENGLSPALDQKEFSRWDRFGLPGLAICSRDIYPLFGTTGEIFAAMDMLAFLKAQGKKQ